MISFPVPKKWVVLAALAWLWAVSPVAAAAESDVDPRYESVVVGAGTVRYALPGAGFAVDLPVPSASFGIKLGPASGRQFFYPGVELANSLIILVWTATDLDGSVANILKRLRERPEDVLEASGGAAGDFDVSAVRSAVAKGVAGMEMDIAGTLTEITARGKVWYFVHRGQVVSISALILGSQNEVTRWAKTLQSLPEAIVWSG